MTSRLVAAAAHPAFAEVTLVHRQGVQEPVFPTGNVSAEQLVLLLEKAEELGVSSSKILCEAGHSFTLDDLRERRVRRLAAADFARICQFYVARIRERASEGQKRLFSREDLNLMCHALVTSLTLREVVDRQTRLFELLERQHGWIELTEADGVASIELQVGPGEKCWERFFRLAGCVGFGRLFAWLIGSDLRATITVADERDRELELIAGMFALPVQFGQPLDAIVFASDHLDRPVVRSGTEMHEYLKVHPFDIYARNNMSVSLHVQVAAAYRSAVLGGGPVPGVNALAKSFGMSAATFRRHLSQEGRTVRVIKDDVRHRSALELLSEDFLHIEQIATMLGFSGVNAFARAFLEWQGDRPTAFRRKVREGSWSPDPISSRAQADRTAT